MFFHTATGHAVLTEKLLNAQISYYAENNGDAENERDFGASEEHKLTTVVLKYKISRGPSNLCSPTGKKNTRYRRTYPGTDGHTHLYYRVVIQD